MALVILFTPKQMSTAKYDEVIRRLEAVGAAAPAGRLYHACYGASDDLRVIDVWESQETFEHFGQTLMPILQEVGVDPGQPEIIPAHNVVAG